MANVSVEITKIFEGVGDEIFEIDEEDYTLSVYKLELWKLGLLTFIYISFALVSNSGHLMIIWYIKWHAPKKRPINRMIFVDQVYLFST